MDTDSGSAFKAATTSSRVFRSEFLLMHSTPGEPAAMKNFQSLLVSSELVITGMVRGVSEVPHRV